MEIRIVVAGKCFGEDGDYIMYVSECGFRCNTNINKGDIDV